MVKYGIVVVTALFYVSAVLHFDYTPDASYVSCRVASQVAAGDGFQFSPGQPSAGTSGPVWTLILAAGVWGGLDGPVVAKTFDLVFSCLALFAVYFLASLILRDKIAAFFAALLFSVDAWVLRASASGLGFSLALLLVAVTLHYGFRREYALASFVNGFLVLTSPLEGIVLFALTMVDGVAYWRRTQALPAPLVRSCALFAIPILPWVAYAVIHSIPLAGDPRIVTFAGTPFSGPAGMGLGSELLWLAASGGVMLTVLAAGHGMAAIRSDWRLMAPSSFPLLWAAAAVGLTLAVNPQGMVRAWILVAPVVMIYGLLGLYYLTVFVIGVGPRGTFALLAVVVLSIGANQAVYRMKVVPEMNRTVVEMQEQVRPMAYWVRSRIAPGETLVVPFVGMITWITGVRVVGSPMLWRADQESPGETGGNSVERLREMLASGFAAAVVDRSESQTRLAAPGSVPVRTWHGAQGALYTLYADSARRSSMLEAGGGTESASRQR